MATTVAGIGVGLIILAFIWVFCIFLCLALSRAQGGIANAGVGLILLAVVLTIILWFFPRGPADEVDYVIYDSMHTVRTAIVSVCGIFLFAGLLLLAVFHCFDLQRAKPLRGR